MRPSTQHATPQIDLDTALERAFKELPTGTAADRLTHFCGRAWDILHSPSFNAAYRRTLLSPDTVGNSAGLSALKVCFTGVQELVTEGMQREEFATSCPSVVSRLLVSSLAARAHWCSEGMDPRMTGVCSRAVAETLAFVLPALRSPQTGCLDSPTVADTNKELP